MQRRLFRFDLFYTLVLTYILLLVKVELVSVGSTDTDTKPEAEILSDTNTDTSIGCSLLLSQDPYVGLITSKARSASESDGASDGMPPLLVLGSAFVRCRRRPGPHVPDFAVVLPFPVPGGVGRALVAGARAVGSGGQLVEVPVAT